MCSCGRKAFRRGLCVTCYRQQRRTGQIPVAPQRRGPDVVEDVEWVLQSGEHHPEAIASRLGYGSPASLFRALRRARRDDLINRIHR